MTKTWQQVNDLRVAYVTTDAQEQLDVEPSGHNRWLCTYTFTGAQLYDSSIMGRLDSPLAVAAFLEKRGVPKSEFPEWLKEAVDDYDMAAGR